MSNERRNRFESTRNYDRFNKKINVNQFKLNLSSLHEINETDIVQTLKDEEKKNMKPFLTTKSEEQKNPYTNLNWSDRKEAEERWKASFFNKQVSIGVNNFEHNNETIIDVKTKQEASSTKTCCL